MIRILAFSLTVSMLCSCATTNGPDRAQLSNVPPEAMPFAKLVLAVKSNDSKALKPLYTARMQAVFENHGWDEAMKAYREVFTETFGEYTLADFAFTYGGDEESGALHITFRERPMGAMKVKREDGEWKLDER